MNKPARSLPLLALALIASACSANGSETADADASNSEDVAEYVAESTFTVANVDDYKVCIETARSEFEGEGGFSTSVDCPGPGPDYKLSVSRSSEERRDHVRLVGPKNAELFIDIHDVVGDIAAETKIGPSAEWRIRRGHPESPHALILPHAFTNEGIGPRAERYYLAVMKISGPKMCLAGVVDMNESPRDAAATARQIADDYRTKSECPAVVTLGP